MILKFIVLFFIIFVTFFIFRLFKKNLKTSYDKNFKEKVVDLEKDPKTNEYRPKE